MNARRDALSWLLVGLLLALAGCTSGPSFRPDIPDVRSERKTRSTQLLKDYEKRRDDAQYQAALTAWNQGNTDIARELVDTLLERAPKYRAGRLLLVQLRLLEQELTEARADADQLAIDFPNDAEVLHVQGLVCEATGDLKQATQSYQRAVELDPKNGTYAGSLANLDNSEAPETSETSQARPPASSQPTRSKEDADHLSATLLKAEVHLALGETNTAQRLTEQALLQTPDESELESLLTRICEGQGGMVAACSDRPLATDPQRRNVMQTAYDAVYEPPPSSEPDSLAVATDEPVLRPANSDPLPAEATPRPRAQPAIKTVSRTSKPRLLAPQPSTADSQRDGLTATPANAAAFDRKTLERALGAPQTEAVAVDAAVAALRHNQPELAARLAQSSLSRWPKSAALYRTLGMAEYRLEHWQSAQASLRQALSLDNSHALSYFLLGCTLKKLGQDQEAERNFVQARQLDARYALAP